MKTVMEGYLDDDEEELDRDEYGSTRMRVFFLGCPVPPRGTILYKQSGDITSLLEEQNGKYVKITIETVDKFDDRQCGECKDRFICLTIK